MTQPYLERTSLLFGEENTARLAQCFVAVIGLGGVGGAAAEALARTGVGTLFFLDADRIAPSNLNRQLISTKALIGAKKTDAAAERIRAVSDAKLILSDTFLTSENLSNTLPAGLDFLIDAIDFVPGKVGLAVYAKQKNLPMITCLGAGNRFDPTKLTISDLFKTSGDPLARKLRHDLRKQGITALPAIVSTEPPHVQPGQTTIGSFMPVTAAAGLIAASACIHQLLGGERNGLL